MAWAWLTQWGILPIAVIGLVVFTAAFWLINAVTWRRRLEKPNTKTPSFDYSYGIDVCAIRMARDNEQDGIQVGIILRNALEAPIAYEVEDFTVSIADTTRDNPDFSNTGGVIHAKGTRVYFFPPLQASYVPQRAEGSLRAVILYGHPEIGHIRRLYIRWNLSVRNDEHLEAVYIIEKEKDEPVY